MFSKLISSVSADCGFSQLYKKYIWLKLAPLLVSFRIINMQIVMNIDQWLLINDQ